MSSSWLLSGLSMICLINVNHVIPIIHLTNKSLNSTVTILNTFYVKTMMVIKMCKILYSFFNTLELHPVDMQRIK